jgi:hypothetical protein
MKPILCLDFDGVIHSYSSGWKGADVVPDPPVDGAIDFIRRALKDFRVAIYSSRSGQPNGILAMQTWLMLQVLPDCETHEDAKRFVEAIEWPQEKPPALVTIDDRAVTFTGVWPSLADLLAFKPWNKKPEPVKDIGQFGCEAKP